ncbi:MAG TPA: glutamate formimidoyltransferase [Methylomirabilota bacterium]|nr:glutamate formimidoyltransferase [Methylomirabilota bacterium]
MKKSLLECVPNVSEGRDRRVIEAIADAVRRTHGVRLADIHSDPDHHRTVFTLLGAPEAVEAGVLALAETALSLIDMRTHHGVHPRLGAVDAVPLVPLRGVSIQEAAAIARRVGQQIGERFQLPVYFYGAAALRPERRELVSLRRGGYEALSSRLGDPTWLPDAGPHRFNERTGAMAIGARDILVAFNVWLDSNDLDAAKSIARAVRESSGGLPGVQAMGFRLERHGCVQVSMNLTDYRRTSLKDAFEAVRQEAARYRISVKRSELVGLAPREALGAADPASLGLPDLPPPQLLESYL